MSVVDLHTRLFGLKEKRTCRKWSVHCGCWASSPGWKGMTGDSERVARATSNAVGFGMHAEYAAKMRAHLAEERPLNSRTTPCPVDS
jgi:hypothetical protein